jgi:hypothetical protein
MNNFKKEGVYVREGVKNDHALQRKMCTEFKKLYIEARASPLFVLAENLPSLMWNLRTYLIVCNWFCNCDTFI